MDVTDRPTSSRTDTKKQQNKADVTSQDDVSSAVSDKGKEKLLDGDCSGISHQDQKQGYDEQLRQEKKEDTSPTIDDIGEPLEESFLQKIRDFLSFSKNVHEEDEEDVPNISDIGEPLDQSLFQKGKEWFKEVISDESDRPPAQGNNDLQNVDKQQDSTAGSGMDVVDGKIKKGTTKNGTPYLKRFRIHRADRMNNIKTTRTTFQPPKNEKSILQWLTDWLDWFRGHRDDEVDFKPVKSYYDMSCYPRGVFTLINLSDFVSGEVSKRKGTEQDAKDLTDLFLELGFMVERIDNPSMSFVNKFLDGVATTDYSKKSCCVCAILSHGDNGIFYAKDKGVNIDEMLKKFESKQLKGIPKFFIIQACRGGIYMDQIEKFEESKKPNEPEYVLSLPGDSDFLCAYSTPPGYYSWRRTKSKDEEKIGSWFIKALVEVFRANEHKEDVLTLLTRVNAKVAKELSSISEDDEDYEIANKRKGIPSFVCQLTKDLVLYPPFTTPINNEEAVILDVPEIEK